MTAVMEDIDTLVSIDPELQVGRELSTLCGMVAGVIADYEEVTLSLDCSEPKYRSIPLGCSNEALKGVEYDAAAQRFEEFDPQDVSEWRFMPARFETCWGIFPRTARVVVALSDDRKLAVIFTVN